MSTIIRHSPPSKLDQAPLGTACKVISNKDSSYDLYVQYNSDPENPNWELMGTFSENSMSEKEIQNIIRLEDNTL